MVSWIQGMKDSTLNRTKVSETQSELQARSSVGSKTDWPTHVLMFPLKTRPKQRRCDVNTTSYCANQSTFSVHILTWCKSLVFQCRMFWCQRTQSQEGTRAWSCHNRQISSDLLWCASCTGGPQSHPIKFRHLLKFFFENLQSTSLCQSPHQHRSDHFVGWSGTVLHCTAQSWEQGRPASVG